MNDQTPRGCLAFMVSLRHKKVVAGSNNPNREVSKTAWNDEHALTGTAGNMIVFDAEGEATEVSYDDLLARIVALEAGGTPLVTLGDLGGTFTLPEDAAAGAVAGAITGKTAGSTLSLADDAGGRVALSGTNIVRGATALDYETATSHNFTVRETHPDAVALHDTVRTLAVTDVSDAISAPTIALTSSGSWADANSPEWDITINGPAYPQAGDTFRLYLDDNTGFTSPTTEDVVWDGTGAITFSSDDNLANGTYYAQIVVIRGGLTSPPSNTASVTISGVGNSTAYRYYRLYITANQNGDVTAIAGMNLATASGGADTATGQTYTASDFESVYLDGSPANAFDGNAATYYSSDLIPNVAVPHWIRVDYGATAGNWKAINELKLISRNDSNPDQMPSNFKLQGSADGSAWTDLITVTGAAWTGSSQTQAWTVP